MKPEEAIAGVKTNSGKPMTRADVFKGVMDVIKEEIEHFDNLITEARGESNTEALATLLLARGELRLRALVATEQVRNLAANLARDALGGLVQRLGALPGARKRGELAMSTSAMDDQGTSGTPGEGP